MNEEAGTNRHLSPGRLAWLRLRRNRMAITGVAVVLLISVASVIGPWVSPYQYDQQALEKRYRPPSRQHWLGTDMLGRDVLTRIFVGGRISLAVGLCATSVSLLIGVLYGAISGYLGRRADQIMMRIVDMLYGLPYMFFVIILVVVFGRNIINLFIALGAVQWLTIARITRGQVLALRHRDFVQAARAQGLRKRRIIFRHLLPNALGPVIVYATLTIPGVMLQEAFLSFLGLGVQPPLPSWGTLVSDGVEAMEVYSWLLICPAVVLALMLFSLNALGDGLRDALDPQMGRR